MNAQETLNGTVERITYFNKENGYTVLKLMPDRKYPAAAAKDGTVAVVGTMPELGTGETVEFLGVWIEDPRYGRQFRADVVTPIMPSTQEGIINYLASGIVKGIGRKTAEKIVGHFGSATIDVLDSEPKRLAEVPGLKAELVRELQRSWAANVTTRQAMIFLQGYGVTTKMAARIFQHYGPATIAKVRDDPFALADDVFGIGFLRADEIARSMGIAPDAVNRIRAGLTYTLNEMSKEGHVFAPRSVLITKAEEKLGVENRERIQAVITSELLRGDLIASPASDIGSAPAVPGDDAIYLPVFYYAERGVSERLADLKRAASSIEASARRLDWDDFIAELAREHSIRLTDQQQGAVQAALVNKVSVLTGGPGTGKTTTLRMAIGALRALDAKFALASPTGRAAKRLSEATGQSAKTIHRLLGYIPGEGFERDEDNPLEIDMLIVDEASMIDLLLFHDLLKALPATTHLMLVGDIDQLPSVGAGNILRDVIDSGTAHVTRLDVIFRQQEDSHIVVNAHRINRGEAPFMDNRSRDFFFFGEEDPAAAAELVVDIVRNRLPSRFDIDPIRDVQVIAPMYRGPIGVNALNEALQRALNSGGRMAEKQLHGRLFRVGDKVMQTRNNYEKEVFNGDIGRINAIDFDEAEIEVTIDGEYVYYDYLEAEELIHAYCISTHRSQGSEYPVVVMPVMTQHYMMLQRNLLYTAVTRAKQIVVLVGSRRAVHMAVNNHSVAGRYTGLRARLQGGHPF
jgi:exodeoxyribonuclease V alpha subunit